jgi:hypothetical protein
METEYWTENAGLRELISLNRRKEKGRRMGDNAGG